MKPVIPVRGEEGDSVNLWPLIARPQTAALPADREVLSVAAAQLAEFVSPVLAHHLLGPIEERLGDRLFEAEAVKHSRLTTSFSLAQQTRWAKVLIESGLEIVFLKGFANAHTLYPEPYLRTQGDLDILVRKADLQRTLDVLVGQGFGFRAAPLSPWGMISDASFLPLASQDGACDIDLHVHPDCYPAYRSLSTDIVFANALTIDIGDVSIQVPCPEHVLTLCVTNTAKDKFDVYSIRKVIDAIILLRDAQTLEWDEIIGLAKKGGFYRPMRYFFALLAAIDIPLESVPASLQARPGGFGGRAFERIVSDFRSLFPYELPLTTLLWREMAICAETRVALHNLGLRFRGLYRPLNGLPDGAPLAPKCLPFTNSSNART